MSAVVRASRAIRMPCSARAASPGPMSARSASMISQVLGDPVRRRILELLADGDQTSGAITDVIRAEFALSQPAVSQHLRMQDLFCGIACEPHASTLNRWSLRHAL